MPKTKISEFSATAGNNTDIDGINIAEGCAPSGINDAIRELMAQLKDFQAGTAGDSFNGPVGTTTPAAGAFTNLSASGTFALTGDQVQISEGGTGQTTANAAFNALAPSQTSNAGKYLKTDGTNTSWDAIEINTADITGTLPIANGGTGLTALGTGVQTALGQNVTGSGGIVLASSPTLTTPNLGTPSAVTLTNATGLPLSTGVTGTLATTNGGTGLTSFTANGVVYASSSSALTTGSALSFNGTYLNANGLRIAGTDTSNTIYQQTGALVITAENSFLGLQANSGNPIIFYNNSTEQARITTTGLGIGTSSPAYKLDVAGTGNQTIAVRTQTSGNPKVYFEASGSNAGFIQYNRASSLLQFSAQDPTIHATLDSSGNLGLGVTPSAWSGVNGVFEIRGNAYIYSTTGVLSSGANAFFNGTNWIYKTTQAATRYEQVNGAHQWGIAPSGTAGNAISFTQAMTLTAQGNELFVGTTSGFSSTTNRGNISVNGSSDSIVALGSNGTRRGYLYANPTQMNVGSDGILLFETGGSERARITSGGDFLVGSTSALSAVSGSYQVKVGEAGIQTTSQAISASTPTTIARSGSGGVAIVSGYNGTGQYSAIVLFKYGGTTTSILGALNDTGGTITYAISGVNLQVTSSVALTNLTVTCIRSA